MIIGPHYPKLMMSWARCLNRVYINIDVENHMKKKCWHLKISLLTGIYAFDLRYWSAMHHSSEYSNSHLYKMYGLYNVHCTYTKFYWVEQIKKLSPAAVRCVFCPVSLCSPIYNPTNVLNISKLFYLIKIW